MGKKIEKNDEQFERHMHDGHRGRLLDTVASGGLYHLSSVQILEFILFYIIPRGDVNPIAHRLLAKYGYLSAVIDAPVEDVAKVKGMGITSAKKLHALLDIFDVYNVDKINNVASISNFGAFLEGIEMLLRSKNEECFYVFGVSPTGKINNGRLFTKGDAAKVTFEMTDITSYVATYKVKSLIFAHNHPGGSCLPSHHDVETNAKLERFLGLCGVQLYDSLIVGKDGIFSCAAGAIRQRFEKEMCKVDNLKDYQQQMQQKPKAE